MSWNYSVVVSGAAGISVQEAPAGGWSQDSAIRWCRVEAPKTFKPGAVIDIYRSRGTTGRARQVHYRSYIIGSDGMTHRTGG